MNISDNIKAIRVQKGLSQAEVARRYGTSPEFYYRLEKKDKTLTIEQAGKIADALKVTVVELLGYGNEGQTKDVEELQIRLRELEKENEGLKAQIAIYQPLAKMVEFMMSNTNGVDALSDKASKGKIGKEDIEQTFPGMNELFEKPDKGTK